MELGGSHTFGTNKLSILASLFIVFGVVLWYYFPEHTFRSIWTSDFVIVCDCGWDTCVLTEVPNTGVGTTIGYPLQAPTEMTVAPGGAQGWQPTGGSPLVFGPSSKHRWILSNQK